MEDFKRFTIILIITFTFVGYLYMTGRVLEGLGKQIQKLHNDRELQRQIDKENWDKHE